GLSKHLPYDTPQIQEDGSYRSNNNYLIWEDVISGPHDVDDWDWEELSCHHNVTMDIITSHPHLPWDWDYVWLNPNMTWDYIQQQHHNSGTPDSIWFALVGRLPC